MSVYCNSLFFRNVFTTEMPCAVIYSNVVIHFSCFPPKIAITKRCEALYVRFGLGYRVEEVSIFLCLCETNTVTQ